MRFSVVSIYGIDVLVVVLGVPVQKESRHHSHDKKEEDTKSYADCDSGFRMHLSQRGLVYLICKLTFV